MSEELKAAQARIACLEGEIAKRDETIARLEPQLNRAIQANYDLREELAACRVAVENCELFRAELDAIKAQEPVAWAGAIEYGVPLLMVEPQNWKATPLYAAPVSEAKAQGVVMPERKEFPELMMADYHEVRGWNACLGEVARLNAASVQQPKCKTCNDNGRIGGPSFYAPDEGGEPCPDCSAPVQQVSVPDEMRSLAQRLREYNQNPHHINPMSEAFHILVADAANALSAACVPKEIAAAITWSEHLLFECGALTSTRAPSVHVYNKTFAAVNEARAMLNAPPAAPAADAWIQVSERLPESERTVLAFYNNSHGKSRRVRAEYIAHMSKGADDGWDGDADAYYDEATDESYWPAGWYEVIDNWDDLTHMVIHEGEVSHWMPLPAGPVAHHAKGVV